MTTQSVADPQTVIQNGKIPITNGGSSYSGFLGFLGTKAPVEAQG